MKLEKIYEEPKIPPNYTGSCPECNNYVVYIHDLRCAICDNKTVIWCPNCKEHYRIVS